MNPIEEDMERRFPEIEELENSVKEFNQLDLNTISVKDLKERLYKSFPFLNFGECFWDSTYSIVRARRNYNNEFDKPFKNVCNIGIPPANLTPFGRANNEYEPIFYGCNDDDLPLFESCQNLPIYQKYEPQNFTVGIWKVKQNNVLNLIPIIESDIAQQNREDIKKVKAKADLIHQSLTSEKVKKGSQIIAKFYADQFAKSGIKSPNDYKISSCFATTIKTSPYKFDGMIYPSVAHKYRKDNVAIFPESLHKIELVRCFSVTMNNFDFDKGTLTKGIIQEGKILESGEIIWKE